MLVCLLGGCGAAALGTSALGTSATAGGTTPGTPSAEVRAPESPLPAFVVHYHGRTLVIPVDPAEPTVAAEGNWIITPESDPPAVVRAWTADPAGVLPDCLCGDAHGACVASLSIAAIPAEGAVPTGLEGCTCAAVGEIACDATPDALAGPMCESPCYRPEGDWAQADPTSIVGDVLYRSGESHEGDPDCGGLNLYYAYSEHQRLVPGAESSDGAVPFVDLVEGTVGATCQPEWGGPGGPGGNACPWNGERWGFPSEAYEDDPNEGAEEDACSLCERSGDATAVFLRAGLLSTQNWGYFGPTIILSDRVTPQRCPTTIDPCGDPARFVPLRDVLERPVDGLDYWVATDGSAALVGERGEVWLPDGTAPVRDAGVDLTLNLALGVHYHADARPMVRAMARVEEEGLSGIEVPPDPSPPIACTTAAECAPGERCSGFCHPPCREDLDCIDLGVCGAFCSATGQCLLMRELGCDAEHACDGGFDCVEETCQRHVAVLDPADAGFVDRRLGRDWGNRCYRHVLAGAFEAAQAACEAGLALAPDDAVRGAILFNLGLAAQGRGWTQRAIEYFTESLAVRENETVRTRLEELRSESEGEY